MHFHQTFLSTVIVVVSAVGYTSGQWAAFYTYAGECGGDGDVQAGWKPDCSGTCHTFSGPALSAHLWATAWYGTTCSVYRTSDCTGSYQSVGTPDSYKGDACTNLYEASYSAKCYNNC